MLDTFVFDLKKMGAALGGPDILLDDPGLNFDGNQYSPPGIYKYYPKLSGSVALAPSIMSSNYRETIASGAWPSRKPEIGELLAFARNNLKANYLFWTRDPDFYWAVLNRLKKKNDPAIELNDACPAAYAPCIRN